MQEFTETQKTLISTVSVSMEPHRAGSQMFSESYDSFQISISKVNFSKVYFFKMHPAYASSKLCKFILAKLRNKIFKLRFWTT